MPDGTHKLPRKRLTADEPSPASVFLDVPNMPWEETKFPGIKCKTLYSDGTGMATLLLEMEPGAEVPLHEHTAIEQTYVLKGHFLDEEGECLPGQFVWRPAGNTHVAWAGAEGATVLGVFLKPNIFADGRKFFTEENQG
ncbi:cupin domain-containing protein [Siccirubricoccus deserti]|uniref:Cupin domain-containing protein n=1 Tax=Siccirubricoccus deserti TaxID=2013562 RepID=A0A9X0QUX4_9PROT|nr:cupin domain-containing protein [Siccirubricoccus deserti]MBC4014339.1 cupin domain-containing protein [Siccirubricoccus deserti]